MVSSVPVFLARFSLSGLNSDILICLKGQEWGPILYYHIRPWYTAMEPFLCFKAHARNPAADPLGQHNSASQHFEVKGVRISYEEIPNCDPRGYRVDVTLKGRSCLARTYDDAAPL